MDAVNKDALLEMLGSLRKQLERAFRPDTAAQGFPGATPSTGHCAAVATIIYELLGGEMLSALVEGHSHWLNRISASGKAMDVDLTGDQFGQSPILIEESGRLYFDARVREASELTDETLVRARRLAERAELAEAVRAIDGELEKRSWSPHRR